MPFKKQEHDALKNFCNIWVQKDLFALRPSRPQCVRDLATYSNQNANHRSFTVYLSCISSWRGLPSATGFVDVVDGLGLLKIPNLSRLFPAQAPISRLLINNDSSLSALSHQSDVCLRDFNVQSRQIGLLEEADPPACGCFQQSTVSLDLGERGMMDQAEWVSILYFFNFLAS